MRTRSLHDMRIRQWTTPLAVCAALGLSAAARGIEFQVREPDGTPVAAAMVTRTFVEGSHHDTSDNGYPAEGSINRARPEVSRFSDAEGRVSFEDTGELVSIRVRKPGYRDTLLTSIRGNENPALLLARESDPVQLAESKPSNLWLSLLDFDGDSVAREHFLRHCAFCHQQASGFMRGEREPSQWREIIRRMNRYGAQLASEFEPPLAAYLSRRYRELREHHERVPDFEPWAEALSSVEVTEWAIGDAFSQMHDLILHPNGMVYVGDNLMDRIYEVDPLSGEYRVYKVPHASDARIGGILGNRFEAGYPKVENYLGVHSFGLSPTDGHIFITPSMQQSLLEFDPVTKQFTEWPMEEGFYPHTVRVDREDRVWFTLALSSKVAMFDRKKRTFRYFDLPPRGLKERVVLWTAQWRLGMGDVSSPPDYDWDNNGFPMPYGIDIAPDGTVWVARLYADDIARIDPETGKVEMIETPFAAPRRLRCDAEGNPWIVGFSSGLIARYDAARRSFDTWPLPVQSETPYALNVDRSRNVVWVNGNQSDTILRFDVATESWRVIPLSRFRTFTRDIEITEDGAIFTSNSNFPGWQIEDGKPTLIRISQSTSASAP